MGRSDLQHQSDRDRLQQADSYQICKMLTESVDLLESKQERFVNDVMEQGALELEKFMAINEDAIKRVFQTYCALGDPLNTEKLFSAKLIKMFKDMELVEKFNCSVEEQKFTSQPRTYSQNARYKSAEKQEGSQPRK